MSHDFSENSLRILIFIESQGVVYGVHLSYWDLLLCADFNV